MRPKGTDRPVIVVLLIAVQAICAAFFLVDVVRDAFPDAPGAPMDWHLGIEAVAVASLILAVGFEVRYLLVLLRHKAHLERQVSLAASAFNDVMVEHFRRWGLTPSEQDVANFLVKGCSIAEIAALRGSAEGTVKSHLNGIYRKAGVGNRGELLSLLIEDMMGVTAAA
ncbi:helix-turn-helix transcriptional regulator [Roseisalinus antarcticus]|uniref:Bacterial regulatory proteins, luxR family n=1 Tax=Roseisalinus antarcticus TaxID=254357 RepID=A0A1Y5RG47_9RHOB|nr:helix-turn-helix transcriptional regulator [Roseisalinus antarcticus]SLN16493.1 Bacterial regulatory proteins, luxR family [Roseisalinus antarcticus]